MTGKAASGLRPGAAFVLFASAAGCNLGFKDTTPDDPVYAFPVITAATVECDPTRARWAFTVDTTGWTGNGQVLLSADGDYVERHALDSVSAAADGTTDHLDLDLDVVSDWRDVNEGSTTVFNCATPDLLGVIRVYDRTGDAVADCRVFGEQTDRWAAWEPDTACAFVLTEDTGG